MGVFDAFAKAFGEAIDDIRHKVVEEGWFGKQVTDTTLKLDMPQSDITETAAWEPPTQSFDALWEVQEHSDKMDLERGIPDQDIEL